MSETHHRVGWRVWEMTVRTTRIFTIGFTKKSARVFFGLLQDSGAERLIDVRLNNVSQLAGFAKRGDLAFFVEELCGIDYRHELDLAPTRTMLDDYRKRQAPWAAYERRVLDLLAARQVEERFRPDFVDNAVLLCSEPTAHHCHRRLVVEYLAERWDGVTAEHL